MYLLRLERSRSSKNMGSTIYLTLFFEFQQETNLTWFCILFLVIPSAPTITDMVYVSNFHFLAISVSRSLYLLSFSNSL